MRKMLVGLAVLLIAGAFVAGYWTQRDRLGQAEAEATELRRQLAEARSELAGAASTARLFGIFGQFLALQEAVTSGNYGAAQALSSTFFDQVRDEGRKTTDGSARAALDAILARRDSLTAGLARGEGSSREVLVPMQRELRRALGYPVPPLAPAEPAPLEARP